MSNEFNPWWVKQPARTQIGLGKTKSSGKRAKGASLAELVAASDATQIEKLLRAGKLSPNEEFSLDRTRRHTLLPVAIQQKWISLALELIKRGADVNRVSVSSTPLMLACADREHACDEIIGALLKAGAKLDLRSKRIEDSGDETALMFAAQVRNVRAIRLLLKAAADAKAQTKSGRTAIHSALVSKRADKALPRLIEVLVDAGCPLLGTELHSPVFARDVETVKLLLRFNYPCDVGLPKGSPKGKGPETGETPLTLAAQLNFEDLMGDALDGGKAALARRVEIVRLLLAAGANPNQPNARGKVPLALATQSEAKAIVQLLVKAGAKSA